MNYFSPEFLDMLQCPCTGQPLRPATNEELQLAHCAADSALVSGNLLYPVVDGIPQLRPQDALTIPLSSL